MPSSNAPPLLEFLSCEPDLEHESDQEAPSLLKLQLIPPPVLVTQPDSLRAHPTRSARIFIPINTSMHAGVQSLRDLSIVSPTHPPHASDRDNPTNIHPLSTVRKKPRVSVRIATAANRSRSPVSRTRSEKSDIVIAARSFQNSLGVNSLEENSVRSARSFCGVITLRSPRTTLLTE